MHLRSEGHVGSSTGKRQYKTVWTGGRQKWDETEKYRYDDTGNERISRQKLGSNKENVSYFATLSRILAVIGVLEKNAMFADVLGRSFTETISHANIY